MPGSRNSEAPLDRFVPQEQERQKAGYASDQWRGEIAKKYVSNLSKAIRVSSALGSEFLAFFQPVLFFRDQLTEEERALGYEPELGSHCNDMLVERSGLWLDRGPGGTPGEPAQATD